MKQFQTNRKFASLRLSNVRNGLKPFLVLIIRRQGTVLCRIVIVSGNPAMQIKS
ncbi:MAG TPA: hypothetical protein GXX36_04020 [Clostridiaceae bacterium]|nr:hypothetical protein [Clostridiaceae bacterium]